MDRVTILGTGNSALKYQRPDEGEIWIINRAFLLEQNPDKMFLFHPLEEVFKDVKDRMLVTYSKPKIITNQKIDMPSAEEYPIDEVVSFTGITYFRCTAAYCLAYASMMGFQRVDLIGMDYDSGKENIDEKACVEFWIGYLRGQGCEVHIHPDSTLCTGLFYGYDHSFKYEEEDISVRRS